MKDCEEGACYGGGRRVEERGRVLIPRHCRNQGRQMTKWIDEGRVVAGVGLSTLTSRKEKRALGKAFTLQWTHKDTTMI